MIIAMTALNEPFFLMRHIVVTEKVIIAATAADMPII
jgi:hypothetical protein